MAHIVEDITFFLKKKFDIKDNFIGIILGSDYGDFLNFLSDKTEIFCKDIPGFKLLGKDAEQNKFVFGKYFDKNIIVSFGRLHFNYGYQPQDVANYIFVLKELGCEKLIITASVGSLNKRMQVGDIVSAVDHINLTGRNSLFGCEYRKYGNLFVDMLSPYDSSMIEILTQTAKKEMKIRVKKGVLVEYVGPSMETFSESKFCHNIGADFSAFHICNEVVAAKYCHLPVLLFGLVTNYASAFSAQAIKYEDIVYNRSCGLNYYLDLLRRFILNL